MDIVVCKNEYDDSCNNVVYIGGLLNGGKILKILKVVYNLK